MTTLQLTPADAPPTEVTLSDAELEKLLDDAGSEFVDGQLLKKPMGMLSGLVVGRLFGFLSTHVQARNAGELFGSETGYRCFPRDPRQVRKPDVSFVAAGRLTPAILSRAYCPFGPDLAVEVVSPNDACEYLEQKVADYRSAGVRLIWVVYPMTRSVLIRRLDRTCAELDEAGTLDGEDVVPGFTCRVAQMFA